MRPLTVGDGITLDVMPKVRVPRKNVTPGEVVTVLSRRLGPRYQVESNGDHRVTVRKSPLVYANVSITDQPAITTSTVTKLFSRMNSTEMPSTPRW